MTVVDHVHGNAHCTIVAQNQRFEIGADRVGRVDVNRRLAPTIANGEGNGPLIRICINKQSKLNVIPLALPSTAMNEQICVQLTAVATMGGGVPAVGAITGRGHCNPIGKITTRKNRSNNH